MVYEARGELPAALKKYQASLAMRQELGDRQGVQVCERNIGVVQARQGDYDTAIATLESALATARKLEILELTRDTLESLALTLQSAGHFERALTTYIEFKKADDELRDQERTRQMIGAQTRFEVGLKDHEIEVLRKDKEIERSRRNALAVGAVLSLLIIVLLLQRYRFQKRAAQEIRRSNAALRQAHAELEEAARDELTHVARVATMGELATAFAHELNQPLAAIQANARAGRNLLAVPAEDRDAAEVDAALQDIGDDAGRAREIIANVRQLMRKGEIRHEPVDLASMVAEALRLVRPECERQGVAVVLRSVPGLSPVTGDRVQLQQVVLNLVQNATAAMVGTSSPHGAIEVQVAQIDDGRLEVAVVDRGPPVSDEVLADMFEPFFTTRPSGLGMGLAICRTIIEAHGGELTARRNDDAGLTVAFRLPVQGGPADQASATT
jgi:C4-dicarboxylate-specific signal transduction histidine kinase